jgi:maleylacetoacetate isomerase
MAMVVACDTHPLNNLPIMGYLRREFGADDAAVIRWVAHWIERGFSGLERWVGSIPGVPDEVGQQRFCFGHAPTLADVCLVPQMYNARRFSVDVAPYPRLAAICAHLEGLPPFRSARPENQPDAETK